jgi:hypothetical protein
MKDFLIHNRLTSLKEGKDDAVKRWYYLTGRMNKQTISNTSQSIDITVIMKLQEFSQRLGPYFDYASISLGLTVFIILILFM